MREIKFRAWNTSCKEYIYNIEQENDGCIGPCDCFGDYLNNDNYVVEQYTGLKDKNGRGLTNVYEGDIIDNLGNIKGSIHEVDKRESDLLIPGVGTRAWDLAYKKAVVRGFDFAE